MKILPEDGWVVWAFILSRRGGLPAGERGTSEIGVGWKSRQRRVRINLGEKESERGREKRHGSYDSIDAYGSKEETLLSVGGGRFPVSPGWTIH